MLQLWQRIHKYQSEHLDIVVKTKEEVSKSLQARLRNYVETYSLQQYVYYYIATVVVFVSTYTSSKSLQVV